MRKQIWSGFQATPSTRPDELKVWNGSSVRPLPRSPTRPANLHEGQPDTVKQEEGQLQHRRPVRDSDN